MQKKLLCLALAVLSTAGAMLSCGSTADSEEPDTAAPETEAAQTTEAVTEAPKPIEMLPAADYGGHAFRCLLIESDDRHVDLMTAGEENGDLLNDLVFRRNRMIEEKYNVKISGEKIAGLDMPGAIRRQVTGGLQDYDLFYYDAYAAALAQEGMLYNLNELENLDLSNPWWDHAVRDGMTFGGKIFMMTGDISPTCLLTTSCLAFNKVLFQNYDMEYPYALAREGKWTLDKLAEMTKGLTQDLNGDGAYTLGDDVFGMTSWFCDSPYSLFFGAGGRYSAPTDEGYPKLDWNYDHITAVYDVMYEIINDNNSYFVTDPAQYPTTYQCFSDGGAFFCEITLQKLELFLRDMKDDYGILPIPKWDEAQPEYLSCVNAAGGFNVVPVNAEDPARTGMIMEALGAAAYTEITPSLYEIITKTKNVRDEESGEMVNLIIRNRVYDPYYIHLLPNYAFAQTMLAQKSKDVVSFMEKERSASEKALENVIRAYASLES